MERFLFINWRGCRDCCQKTNGRGLGDQRKFLLSRKTYCGLFCWEGDYQAIPNKGMEIDGDYFSECAGGKHVFDWFRAFFGQVKGSRRQTLGFLGKPFFCGGFWCTYPTCRDWVWEGGFLDLYVQSPTRLHGDGGGTTDWVNRGAGWGSWYGWRRDWMGKVSSCSSETWPVQTSLTGKNPETRRENNMGCLPIWEVT